MNLVVILLKLLTFFIITHSLIFCKMIELVYYSKANAHITAEDIHSILQTARQYNFRNDITGCLLYQDGEFLQILEGEEDTVLSLFDQIKQDNRHSDVRLLAKENINYRMFFTWSMAFYKFGDKDLDSKLFTRNIEQFSDITGRPNRVLDLFWVMSRYITEARYKY